jgi:hypothetical protein
VPVDAGARATVPAVAGPDPVLLDARWLLAAARAVVGHPTLWVTALRQALVLAPRGWWRRRPFLPVPDPAYLRFRLLTAYGDPGQTLEPADLVTYLRWCRAWPRVTG